MKVLILALFLMSATAFADRQVPCQLAIIDYEGKILAVLDASVCQLPDEAPKSEEPTDPLDGVPGI